MEWAEIKVCDLSACDDAQAEEGAELTEKERKEIKPMERIKMIMTRGKDDRTRRYSRKQGLPQGAGQAV